jgi:hypothetical protein
MYKLALGNLGDFDATKSFPPLMNPKSSQVMDHHWDHLNRDASSNVLRASALGQKSRKPSARTKETLLLENWAPLNNKFVSQSKETSLIFYMLSYDVLYECSLQIQKH